MSTQTHALVWVGLGSAKNPSRASLVFYLQFRVPRGLMQESMQQERALPKQLRIANSHISGSVPGEKKGRAGGGNLGMGQLARNDQGGLLRKKSVSNLEVQSGRIRGVLGPLPTLMIRI